MQEVKCERCSYWIPENEAFYSHSDIDEDVLLVTGFERVYHAYFCKDCALAEGIEAAFEEAG